MRALTSSFAVLVMAILLFGGGACASVWGFGDATLAQTTDAGATDGAPSADGAPCGAANACDGRCGQIKDGCGALVDCGSCPSGQTCGGAGTAGACGVGTCTPSCAEKPCGDTNGCDGVCISGACGQGLLCIAGTCACDPTTCAGCCKGNVCAPGTADDACGTGGAACSACGAGTCGGGGQAGVCGSSFVKYGDDGSVSCDAYCGGTRWGPVGACVLAQAFDVPCDQVVGRLTNGAELTCLCDAGAGKFAKHGNDGTASCTAYCAGTQGGPAANKCDLGVARDVPCSQPVGMLANGSELMCTCSGATTCTPATCPTPANGFATCAAGACAYTCKPGYLACAAGCCKAPPAFQKYGNDGTSSCDDYCASAGEAPSASCLEAQALDVPCSQATGYFSNKSYLTCTCANNGQSFDKPGDDGSASCDTYCAGAQWGPTGTCVHAAAIDVPCSQSLATGRLTNGTHLHCTCQ